ncbi:hypothetical protein [Maribacter luteus]|uniref:hypothetical protein n=1 Tax=Maribacter luteus TaxID=2594478 RepID=UPI0024933410|nr:hypothetical protein [Maribacter luteus]
MFDEGLQIKGDAINVLYKLPDTLTIKDTLKGYIVYKSVYDTLRVPNKEHFVDFYLAKTNFLSKDYMEFRTKKSDTFARIRDSIIPIYDITFKKRGAHMLEGYIVDHLYYDVGNDSVHYKSLKNQVMYSVYVK